MYMHTVAVPSCVSLTAADGCYLRLVLHARAYGVAGGAECAGLVPPTRGRAAAGEVADDGVCGWVSQTAKATGEGRGGQGKGRREMRWWQKSVHHSGSYIHTY